MDNSRNKIGDFGVLIGGIGLLLVGVGTIFLGLCECRSPVQQATPMASWFSSTNGWSQSTFVYINKPPLHPGNLSITTNRRHRSGTSQKPSQQEVEEWMGTIRDRLLEAGDAASESLEITAEQIDEQLKDPDVQKKIALFLGEDDADSVEEIVEHASEELKKMLNDPEVRDGFQKDLQDHVQSDLFREQLLESLQDAEVKEVEIEKYP